MKTAGLALLGQSLSLRQPLARPIDEQTQWVVNALVKKFGTNTAVPNAIIVNKAKAFATAVSQGKSFFTFDILFGNSGKDAFLPTKSPLEQKVTPAGSFEDIKIVYDPRIDSKLYRRQMLISFLSLGSTQQASSVVAFHSILDPQKDAKNLLNADPSDNRVSNGCIRLSYDDLDKVLDFCLGEKRAFIDAAPKRNRFSEIDCPILVIIMPEEDTSLANTLKFTKLSDSGPNKKNVPLPKQNP